MADVGNPGQNYAVLLRLVRRHQAGERPLADASEAVRKRVISETPPDAAERPAPAPLTPAHDPAIAGGGPR